MNSMSDDNEASAYTTAVFALGGANDASATASMERSAFNLHITVSCESSDRVQGQNSYKSSWPIWSICRLRGAGFCPKTPHVLACPNQTWEKEIVNKSQNWNPNNRNVHLLHSTFKIPRCMMSITILLTNQLHHWLISNHWSQLMCSTHDDRWKLHGEQL